MSSVATRMTAKLDKKGFIILVIYHPRINILI